MTLSSFRLLRLASSCAFRTSLSRFSFRILRPSSSCDPMSLNMFTTWSNTHVEFVLHNFVIFVVFGLNEILYKPIFRLPDPLQLPQVIQQNQPFCGGTLTLPGTKPFGSNLKMFWVPNSSPWSSTVLAPSNPWWIRLSNVPSFSCLDRCCLCTTGWCQLSLTTVCHAQPPNR